MNKLLAGISLAAMMAVAPAFAQSPTAPSTTNDNSTIQNRDTSTGTMNDKSAPATPPAATTAPAEKMGDAKSMDTTAAATAGTKFNASNLMNASVRNAANESVGDINDLLIDSTGKVTGVVVGVGGFLGIGERDVVVPFEQIQFRSDSNGSLTVMSNLTKESAKALPEYKEDRAAAK